MKIDLKGPDHYFDISNVAIVCCIIKIRSQAEIFISRPVLTSTVLFASKLDAIKDIILMV